MNFIFSTDRTHYKNEIIRIIKNFKNEGTLIGNEQRNIVKYFDINGLKINFKSFKQPNSINRIVYKYFRKSKARRSFEYANLLIGKNFNTPQPIAFLENYNFFGLTSSYYICEHLEEIFTLSKVLESPIFNDKEEIIKGYTLLIYQLHENGIEFIDNSSGNILIKKVNSGYRFFLVDLNRMNFHNEMKIPKRLKNFSRLTNSLEIIKIISAEYSLLTGIPVEYCLKTITNTANKQVYKRRLKNKLKFYKSLKLKISNLI
jgi:hypothetical protein